MYNEEMRKAFHLIQSPGDFKVTLVDFDSFISIQIDPEELSALDNDIQVEAVEYINKVKKALETHGAIVLVSRKALEDNDELG